MDKWVDVIENRDEYDFIFNLPTEGDLELLKPNDMVKISNGFERFFVRIIEILDDGIIGVINNHLRGRYDYGFDDRVKFENRHIFTIIKAEDQPAKPAKISKNTARMMKMLGKDPLTGGKEMKLFESLQK